MSLVRLAEESQILDERILSRKKIDPGNSTSSIDSYLHSVTAQSRRFNPAKVFAEELSLVSMSHIPQADDLSRSTVLLCTIQESVDYREAVLTEVSYFESLHSTSPSPRPGPASRRQFGHYM